MQKIEAYSASMRTKFGVQNSNVPTQASGNQQGPKGGKGKGKDFGGVQLEIIAAKKSKIKLEPFLNILIILMIK